MDLYVLETDHFYPRIVSTAWIDIGLPSLSYGEYNLHIVLYLIDFTIIYCAIFLVHSNKFI